ncbi:hypothetical protein KSP39_PZI011535 [Platanthera zijinensis]|uniref:Uncharacterized protein n=1 Tax=Platanthera zijinensis TaxID=2320716 RepID=A0AAP0BFR7_9ASPA
MRIKNYWKPVKRMPKKIVGADMTAHCSRLEFWKSGMAARHMAEETRLRYQQNLGKMNVVGMLNICRLDENCCFQWRMAFFFLLHLNNSCNDGFCVHDVAIFCATRLHSLSLSFSPIYLCSYLYSEIEEVYRRFGFHFYKAYKILSIVPKD